MKEDALYVQENKFHGMSISQGLHYKEFHVLDLK